VGSERSPLSREAAQAAAEARLQNATLGDLEAVRLLLRGGSVVDWHRLDFRDHDEVDRYLRANEIDPTRERDVARLENLRADAVDYLVRNFAFRLPDDVAERVPARDLFLIASRRTKRQIYACVVLKVMHIIHHLAGRELLYKLPISDDDLFRLVQAKTIRIAEEIRASGHPIIELEWSRKPRDSLVTKLLAKRSTLAANIYDKTRFRLVLRDREDILPVLIELTHRLIPFNYVVPNESVNDILGFRKTVEDSPSLAKLAPGLQGDIGLEEREDGATGGVNEFSGPGYRIINFVVDLPVRVDDFLSRIGDPGYTEHGPIVFVLTEFQVLDAKTAHDNETGENSHDRYKERQAARVKQRLLRGLAEKPTVPAGPMATPGVPDKHDDTDED
jgi:uncharacterized protein (TIGR04552 family)